MNVQIPNTYNLADYFVDRHLREGRGDKNAIICDKSCVNYAALAEVINRAGNGLKKLGLQREQRVLIVLPDIPEFAAAYFGAIKIGAVAVPTSASLRAPDYAYFLEESQARAAIVHSTLLPEFTPALAAYPNCSVIVCGEPVAGYLHWDKLLRESSPDLEAASTSKDDFAFWLWTSGSTGRPKAAVHQHADWSYCCEHYAQNVLGVSKNDVLLSTSKLFHAYGLGNGLMFPFYAGSTTVLYPGKPQPKDILEYAQMHRPTLFFSVPTLYVAMLRAIDQGSSYDLSSIRLAISAAEPLPADVYRRWKALFGIEILDGIGSTEVLHIYLSARAGNARAGSTGQPVPGYEVRIVDHEGRPVGPGTIGDLLVAGPSTALCYWNRKALTQDRMRGRWFFTGDKYWVDEEGFYWYAGRSDDMFRVSGQWVSPIEVEGTLIEHPCVLEAAVIAYQEETELHTPKAYVVLKEGYTGNVELINELQDFVKQRIARYKCPCHVEFISEIPKSAAGKLLRYKLRELGGQSDRVLPKDAS